ncbi:MAG: hypothetical protein JRJ26_13900, partial [Deltaproteobacteria bacterium]|nr:hypothetical protein [Deltaproteobacteria bacterium]
MHTNDEGGGKQIPVHTQRAYDDEVELIDYLQVLWKYKFWIIGVTFVSAVAALVLSFLLPPVWEVSMVIEPGRFGSDVFEPGNTRPTGKIYYIDTAENVKAKIEQGSYDSQVRALSGWPPDTRIKWNVDVKRGTSAVRAAVEVNDIELGMKALQALATSLEKEFTNSLE